MPTNKNALLRYLAIDRRIRAKYLPPSSLEDLIEYVRDKLEGAKVSKRTIQLDIETMRYNNALAAYAPIKVISTPDRKWGTRRYTYEDPEYHLIKALIKNHE